MYLPYKKMVYKKIIKRGNRTYGPYLYENKRVGNKVITTYVGRAGYDEKKRKFNLSIWYVSSNESSDYKTWLWIPISKVFESGIPIFTSSKSKMEFYAVPQDEFIQIANDDSLDRLLSKCFLDETKKLK